MKKIIGLLLSFTLVFASLIIPTFAINTTDFEAATVLSDLGILEGRGNGDLELEANVTRAEMTAIICRAKNAENSITTSNDFTDVPSDHWAAGYIGWAAAEKIVNGRGNGIFDPDANVTINEAIKMIVSAMGYEYYVENYLSGYPTGYNRIAGSYKIDAGINTSNGIKPATREDIATLIYNALDAPLMDYNYSIGKDIEYVIYNGSKNVDNEKRTLLSYYSDVYKFKATVEETFKNNTEYVDNKNNKLMTLTILSAYGFDEEWLTDALGKTENAWNPSGAANALTKVIANNEVWANYQGYTVDVYVTLNDNNKLEIVSIVPTTVADNELVIDNAREVISKSTVNSTVEFEYEDENGKDRTPDIDIDAIVYVNNMVVGSVSADGKEAFEDLATSEYASVTLLDSNDDGIYDKIYMTNYIYGIVEEVDVDYEVIETTDNEIFELSEDDTQEGFIYNIYKDGEQIGLEDLVPGDMLNIVIGNPDGDITEATFADIYVTNNVIEATISSVSFDNKYTINGKGYYTADSALCGALDPGDTGIFYITIDGYIYDVDFTSAYSDNYGFIFELGVNNGAFGNTWEIKLLDKNNKVRIIPVRNTRVTIDGISYTDTGIDTQLTAIKNDFVNVVNTTVKADAIDAIDNNLEKRLVTFKEVNGEITELTFAVLNGDDREFNYSAFNGTYSDRTARLDGKELLDTTVLFNIPLDKAVKASGDTYILDFNLIQVYNQNGLVDKKSYNGFVYNVDSNNGIGAAVLTDDMGFAGNTNALAVVTSKSTGLDVDGNTATIITFIQAGETKSLAISNAYIGDIELRNANAGDVFQYTENTVGEIANANVIWAYETKTLLDVADGEDVEYIAGVVTENTGKVISLAWNGGEETYAWDELNTNVLYNTSRAGKTNAFVAKNGTSYIRAYKADEADTFTTDVYFVVLKLDDSIVTDVIAYLDVEEDIVETVTDYTNNFVINEN